MDKVINLGIPHVSELIFENIDTPELIKWLEVSQTWNELVGNILIKRWKGKLIDACFQGEFEIVKLLLERTDAQLDARNEKGNTGFHVACYKGHKDIVQMLLNCSDIEVNATDIDGRTAFMLACYDGHKDVVQLLMNCQDKIIELNTRDIDGDTAFNLACYNGHKDIVQLLLNCSDKKNRP